MPWIYILHLDRPLCHARHYSGCTPDIAHRLRDHANGLGSRLTRELFDQGIDWTLASLFQVKEGLYTLRQAEAFLKRQHHAARYCRTCAGAATIPVPGTNEVPLQSYCGPIRSDQIRQAAPTFRPIHSPSE